MKSVLILKIALASVVGLLLFGCSTSEPPSCTDEKILKIVNYTLAEGYTATTKATGVESPDLMTQVLETPQLVKYDKEISKRFCRVLTTITLDADKVLQTKAYIQQAQVQTAMFGAHAPMLEHGEDVDINKYLVSTKGAVIPSNEIRVPIEFTIQLQEKSVESYVEVNVQGPHNLLKVMALAERDHRAAN